MTSNASSLMQRNINILFWARLFGSMNLYAPVLTLFYLQRGLSTSDFFVVILFWTVSVMLFEVPTGAFADRFGAKASFLTGCLLSIIGKVCLLFAYDPWVFYLSSALDGIAITFFSGAEEALIYESLKEAGQEDQMSAVTGKINSAGFFAMSLAYLPGAFFAKDLTDMQFMMLILIGLLFQLVQFALLLRVANPSVVEKFRDESPWSHVRNGVTLIRQTPNLFFLFANVTILFIASVVGFGRMDQLYMTEAGLPVAWLGVVYAGGALISFFISRRVEWLMSKFPPVMLLHMTNAMALLAIIAAILMIQNLAVAFVVYAILNVSKSIRNPIYSQLSNEYIPSGSRATTLSLLSVIDAMFDVILFTTFALLVSSSMKTLFIGLAVIVGIGMMFPIRRAVRTGDVVTE